MAFERHAGLARSKKKPKRKSPSAAVEPTSKESEATPAAAQSPPASPGRMKLAAAVAAVWIAALAGLAFSTANEPMLNRVQIEQADLIVTAKVVHVQQGTVTIEKAWKPTRADEPVIVRDLTKTKARSGSTYILPLTSTGGNTYEITRPALRRNRDTDSEQQRPPRIYTATDDAVEQLREMLGN